MCGNMPSSSAEVDASATDKIIDHSRPKSKKRKKKKRKRQEDKIDQDAPASLEPNVKRLKLPSSHEAEEKSKDKPTTTHDETPTGKKSKKKKRKKDRRTKKSIGSETSVAVEESPISKQADQEGKAQLFEFYRMYRSRICASSSIAGFGQISCQTDIKCTSRRV